MRQDDIGIHLNQKNEDEEKYEEGEKEFIDACLNDDFDTMKSLFEQKKNKSFNPDDLDLIIIKSPAPEPIPAAVVAPTPVKKTIPKPVFLNRKNRGECGVEGKLIMFPLLHMGCCEDPRGLVMTVTIPIPEKIDKKFLSGFADIVKKHPYFDWSGSSFMKNVIQPNREHIQMVMGLDDFFLKRVMEDLYVVINHWYEAEIDEDDSDYGEDYVPLNHTTFFTDRNCEY